MDSWNHIVATYNRTMLKLYVNGNPALPIGYTVPISTNTNSLFIGRHFSAIQPTTNGLIDEVRIYNEALRAGEVQMRYAQGLNGLLARGMISQEEFDRRMNELQLTDN